MTFQINKNSVRFCGSGTVLLAVVILACFHLPVFAEEGPDEGENPLLMGVFPIVSGVALFKRFAPLKDYLANELGTGMVLETAKDFATFVQRTAECRYDIVITAPHFSLLAADCGDYRIVARPKQDLVSLIVVKKTSAITELSQLAGQEIATPPASALVTRFGKDYLEAQGLTGDKAADYHAYKSHNAAFESVLVKHAAAALVSNNAVNKALERGVPLRVIDTLPPLPNMPTLVKASLPITFAQQVERALVTMEDTVRGRDVLEEIGFPGYISAGVEDYESVRPYKPVSPDFGSKTARAR